MKRTKTISHREDRSFPPGIGIADNLPSRLGIVHLMRPLSGVGNIMATKEGITLSPRRSLVVVDSGMREVMYLLFAMTLSSYIAGYWMHG